MRVLIDTNVLISAALSANSTPYRAYVKAASYPNHGMICEQNVDEMKQLLQHQRTHIPAVQIKGGALRCKNDLIKDPALRHTRLIEGLDRPHAVILHNDLGGLALLLLLQQEKVRVVFSPLM